MKRSVDVSCRKNIWLLENVPLKFYTEGIAGNCCNTDH